MKKEHKVNYLIGYFYVTKDNSNGWGSIKITIKGKSTLIDPDKTREMILSDKPDLQNIVIISISRVSL